MAQIIELTNRSGLDYLQGMLKRAGNMRPVLMEIGEDELSRAEKSLDGTTRKYVDGIDDLLKHKEAELLEI